MKRTLAAGGAAALGLQVMAAAPAQQAARFDVNEYRIEGNTLLPAALLETAVTPFLGPDRTADDVDRARGALDALYASHGYPTVSAEIPEQDPSDGIVVLRVTERRVGRLRVRGARYFSPAAIRAGVPSLAEGRVPNLNDVQREIVGLNQWPDRTVTPVLRPGAAPGTVDVDLNVKDTLPLQATVEINNRQSANTTPLRTLGSVSYNNLWQRGDALALSYQVAPERPSNSAGADRLLPVPPARHRPGPAGQLPAFRQQRVQRRRQRRDRPRHHRRAAAATAAGHRRRAEPQPQPRLRLQGFQGHHAARRRQQCHADHLRAAGGAVPGELDRRGK